VSSAPAPVAGPPVFRPGLIPRGIAFFSGTVGFTLKIVLLSISNALAAWAAYELISHKRWPALAVLIAATAFIDFIYLVPRRWAIPAKFLVPGTIFLIGFQLIPIAYTINVAFSNYSTGHILTKDQAIEQIKVTTLTESGRQFDMAIARDSKGVLTLILRDPESGKVYSGTNDGLKPLPPGDVTVPKVGPPTAAKGYTFLKGAALFALDKEISAFRVPTTGDNALQPQGTEVAVELAPSLQYDRKRDRFTRKTDGKVFEDNGRGSFVSGKEELLPGWKTHVGFRNFSTMIHDPLVRKPFLSVFAWTFVFAATTVLFSFAIGLFLAIALDKKGLRFQKLYRSVVVIPYAIPGFLSLLVWQGLLNDDFGVVNHSILGHLGWHPPWLFGGNLVHWIPFITWPRIAVIFVSVWLTTPYFFLVSMGALQSIPEELTEAARVDGGRAHQIFRRVTLPLLLVAVAPLMIASFAFNFNNFNNIYLLTRGGPYTGASSVAGNTDILISYTYKIAIATGTGGNYALASAFAIIIFFVVASISAVSFLRTSSLETMR
jgi:arabinogalactan oligomer / maltooligosaccharide transport system permease protein